MKYHYRIIKIDTGDPVMTSPQSYDTRVDAMTAGEKTMNVLGYKASRYKILISESRYVHETIWKP